MWGLTYSVTKWLQISAGLRGYYTDNKVNADKLELRPFAGVKLYLPNGNKIDSATKFFSQRIAHAPYTWFRS